MGIPSNAFILSSRGADSSLEEDANNIFKNQFGVSKLDWILVFCGKWQAASVQAALLFFVDMQIKTLSEFNFIRPRCILIGKSLSNIIIRYSATPYYLPLVSNLQFTLYITTHSYHCMFPALFSEVSLGNTMKPLLLLKPQLLKRRERESLAVTPAFVV